MSGAVDFPSVAWTDEGPGIRARAAQAAGSRWAIVEYGPGAARDEWCTDGHRGYGAECAVSKSESYLRRADRDHRGDEQAANSS